MSSPRLLIVSNRLPVTARVAEGAVRLTAASGGLATGLRPWHEGEGGRWIGWPGDVSRFSARDRADLDRQLEAKAIVPVNLSRDHIDRYYHGFSNRVLWPLFHDLIDRLPVEATGWDAYRQVNETFADVVAREYRTGDAIWVHDYQLMLLPALLRERLPDARIGFFLHIPFPSAEIFRILPWRSEILSGLLGADLVGFHAFSYLRHFMSALPHVDGALPDIDRVRVGDREVQLGVFPMGVDAAEFADLARQPDVVAEAESLRRDAGGRRIVLGVDRLDYTKGIPRRLQAIERLLASDPGLADTLRYIQVAVPSRGEVDSYQRFKRQLEETVGRINGVRGTLRSAPVHYIHQRVSPRQLVALYLAADVMLVTPLRDGMNLVAKEFVASRVDGDGVLLLSEFAGAAAELDGAVLVNPYDVGAVAQSIRDALRMPADERRGRMATLRQRVTGHDLHAWASGFLGVLAEAHPVAPPAERGPERLTRALGAARRAAPESPLRVLLDYDGTLVPLTASPEQAAPDPDVLSLLAALGASPRLDVEIVSGRPRETLEAWFGHLPLALSAEHGLWHRPGPDAAWTAALNISPEWTSRVRPILDQFVATTPGSHVETKSATIGWHYRQAQPEFGARQARELRMMLGQALANQPFEVLEGKKVIEVRVRGVSKALVAHRMQADPAARAVVLAMGDDRTDEDLFRALPASSLTVAVGDVPARARFRLDDHRAVRDVLRSLLDQSSARKGREERAGDGAEAGEVTVAGRR